MKKLEELLHLRDSELESQRKANEAAREARKKEFMENIVMYSLQGGGTGFFLSLLVGFYKGCGLFHYEVGKGRAYIFDTTDAGKGFWVLPLIGLILGLLIAIISSKFNKN